MESTTSSSSTGVSISSGSSYIFDLVTTELDCVKNSRDIKEQLVQYNLDESLQFFKFRITGSFQGQSASDYEDLLKDFFTSTHVLSALQTSGEPKVPVQLKLQTLSQAVMTMDFFDRLEENGILSAGGKIRGCFDETFDGITVGDLLREMLLNENSEKASVYTDTEKTELIYHLFKVFAVGGSLCQPETSIEKYLSITKAFYKELVTVFKDSKTESIKVAGRSFIIEEVGGLDLFTTPDSPHNRLIVIVDPVKKFVNVFRQSFKSFW